MRAFDVGQRNTDQALRDRIAELERQLQTKQASWHETLEIEIKQARTDERERCLKAKPEAPVIVLEPFTDDARTQWACGYEAALDDWEKEIRALGDE